MAEIPSLGTKRKRGRPSLYSQKMADKICSKLALGISLREICREKGMPSPQAVVQWCLDDKLAPGFSEQYARSREIQAEVMADEIFEISDDATNDYVERTRDDGVLTRVLDKENVMRSRLRVDSRKWYLSKVLPKKYGDRSTVDLAISGTLNLADALNSRRQKREDGQGS